MRKEGTGETNLSVRDPVWLCDSDYGSDGISAPSRRRGEPFGLSVSCGVRVLASRFTSKTEQRFDREQLDPCAQPRVRYLGRDSHIHRWGCCILRFECSCSVMGDATKVLFDFLRVATMGDFHLGPMVIASSCRGALHPGLGRCGSCHAGRCCGRYQVRPVARFESTGRSIREPCAPSLWWSYRSSDDARVRSHHGLPAILTLPGCPQPLA